MWRTSIPLPGWNTEASIFFISAIEFSKPKLIGGVVSRLTLLKTLYPLGWIMSLNDFLKSLNGKSVTSS
jgi:hypothetical protein